MRQTSPGSADELRAMPHGGEREREWRNAAEARRYRVDGNVGAVEIDSRLANRIIDRSNQLPEEYRVCRDRCRGILGVEIRCTLWETVSHRDWIGWSLLRMSQRCRCRNLAAYCTGIFRFGMEWSWAICTTD